VAALPVTKPDVFLQTAQRLLVERAGFAAVAAQPQSVKLFERRGERVGVAVVRGYGLLARTQDRLLPSPMPARASANRPSRVTRAGRRAQETGAQDFIALAPAGSSIPLRFTSRPLPGDAAVSLQGSQQGSPRGCSRSFPRPMLDGRRVRYPEAARR